MGLNPNDLPEHFKNKINPRLLANLPNPPPPLSLSEADHQANFALECTKRGWRSVWHSLHKPSTANRGTPDFVVAALGSTFWIEFKLPHQSLSPDQAAFKKQLAANGVHLFIAHSADEALNFILNHPNK